MTALSRRSLFGWLAAAPAAVTGMVEAVKAKAVPVPAASRRLSDYSAIYNGVGIRETDDLFVDDPDYAEWIGAPSQWTMAEATQFQNELNKRKSAALAIVENHRYSE